jgi:cholesterol oxidase
MENKYDYVIIGSGFGGSVSALRLTEKGYKVAVLEQGSRFTPEKFPKSSWQISRWLWFPFLRWKGFFSMRIFRHAFILHGCAVGGGSITYANTLLRPSEKAFTSGAWAPLANWSEELDPHYKTSMRMLGVIENKILGPGDIILKKTAEAMGVGHTFYRTQVAVFQASEDQEVGATYPDPYFGGEGPERKTCIACGGCMVGCQHNAKNSLDKNYLYLAEKYGAEVFPETKVTDVIPKGKEGQEGYEIVASGKKFHTKGVIFSASALGSMELLFAMKEKHLPNLSNTIGDEVRTNSESLVGMRIPGSKENLSSGIAIGSGVYIDEKTHIEATRYTHQANMMALLTSLMTRGTPGFGRILLLIRNCITLLIKNPILFFRLHAPYKWAQEIIIFLCMQTSEGKIRMRWKRPWYSPWRKVLVTEGENIPTFIPSANEFAFKAAEIFNGHAMSMSSEILFNIPSTAHILGGCPMGKDASTGVINHRHEVFGYKNMLICDGSVVSANLGVNPSLTICALAERAMGFIEKKA